MPKPYTVPLLIDQQKTLTVGYLSKNKYFIKNKIGATGWVSSRTQDLDVRITSIMQKDSEHIFLDYIYNNQLISQKINLECKPSNLGKGLIWFFICPFTNTRCRNLIFIDGNFMHRSNLINAMYSIQSESKKWRLIFQLQPNILETQAYLKEPQKKYYKKYYNGNLTKRYYKYLKTLQKWRANHDKRESLLF